MTKVTVVKKTRQPYTDALTGQIIPAGSEVYTWALFREPRKVSVKMPKQSDLTSSEKMATIYRAEEAIAEQDPGEPETVEDAETFADTVEEQASEVRTVGEEYGESADSMESAFQNGSSKIDELREKAEAAETMATALEEAAEGIRTAATAWQEFLDTNWVTLDGAKTPDDLPDDVTDSFREEFEGVYQAVVDAINEATSVAFEG